MSRKNTTRLLCKQTRRWKKTNLSALTVRTRRCDVTIYTRVNLTHAKFPSTLNETPVMRPTEVFLVNVRLILDALALRRDDAASKARKERRYFMLVSLVWLKIKFSFQNFIFGFFHFWLRSFFKHRKT